MSEILEAIGLTAEELQERVIDRAAAMLAKRVYTRESDELHGAVQRVITEVVGKVADEELKPWATGQIEAVVMQRTNEWGEAKGEAVTFRQYLVQRAEAYLLEKVDYDGKSREESRFSGSSFTAKGTRIAWMVNQHLHHEIEGAMKSALTTTNNAIAAGIQETVRLKLAEISTALRVEVKGTR